MGVLGELTLNLLIGASGLMKWSNLTKLNPKEMNMQISNNKLEILFWYFHNSSLSWICVVLYYK